MPQTAFNNSRQPRITIRVGRKTLAFAIADAEADHQIRFEPYTVKSGISMAANLREAFKNSDLLAIPTDRAMILVDTQALIIPIEEYDEQRQEALFHYTFTKQDADTVMHNILPQLNAVAVFAINKDLKLVIDDHFRDVRFTVASTPVWNHLHQRSFTGNRRKLYGYFHEQQLDIICYDKNRFKFCNTYTASRHMDATYFLLYVWKQLALDTHKDELHLVGDIPERDLLTDELHHYVQNVYVINPSADFNRAPITQIPNLHFDIMTYYVKGR